MPRPSTCSAICSISGTSISGAIGAKSNTVLSCKRSESSPTVALTYISSSAITTSGHSVGSPKKRALRCTATPNQSLSMANASTSLMATDWCQATTCNNYPKPFRRKSSNSFSCAECFTTPYCNSSFGYCRPYGPMSLAMSGQKTAV